MEPIFEHEGLYFTLVEMLLFNGELPRLRNWLMLANVGDSKDFGGGAVGEAIVTRID